MTLSLKANFMPESLGIAQCMSYSHHSHNKVLDQKPKERRVHLFMSREQSPSWQTGHDGTSVADDYIVSVVQEQRQMNADAQVVSSCFSFSLSLGSTSSVCQ